MPLKPTTCFSFCSSHDGCPEPASPSSSPKRGLVNGRPSSLKSVLCNSNELKRHLSPWVLNSIYLWNSASCRHQGHGDQNHGQPSPGGSVGWRDNIDLSLKIIQNFLKIKSIENILR